MCALNPLGDIQVNDAELPELIDDLEMRVQEEGKLDEQSGTETMSTSILPARNE